MKIVDRSHVTLSHQRFSNSKIWKKLIGKRSRRSGKGLVWQFVLLFGWNNEDVRRDVFLLKSIGKLWVIYKFFRLVVKLKIVHNFQMDLNRKNPTVHLHYFIHRVRQNCQTNHFPFLRGRFLASFSIFWIWKTVHVMASHDFCQRFSWKITKGNVLGNFHIPTGCGRCINKGFQKIPNWP